MEDIVKDSKKSILNFIFNKFSYFMRLRLAAKFPKNKKINLRDFEYQLKKTKNAEVY